jgi:CBS-domain-containing membrane protein
MFSVYGTAGRMFTGTLEQLRDVTPVSAARRAQAAQPMGRDSADSAYGTLADDANRAYTQTQQGPSARRPLTTVQELMSRRVFTLPSTATVMQAWRLLVQRGVGQAPVLDADERLVGLMLRADLLPSPYEDAQAWRTLLTQPVTALMWSPVPAVAPETDIRRVAQVLLDMALPGLPVIDAQDAVIGFVSRSDILRAVVNDPPLDLWT